VYDEPRELPELRHDRLPYTIKLSPEPQRSLLYEMWARPRKNNNNTFVTVTGSTGSGKSYGNIFFGYILDVDTHDNHLFNEEQIIFDPLDFVKKVKKPKRIGQFFMKDEIQLDAHARKSFSKINEVLGNIISTVRYKREIIFLNLPSEIQLDSQIRQMRFGNLEFNKVAPSGEYSQFSFDYLEYPKKADTKSQSDKSVTRDPLVLWEQTKDAYVRINHYTELLLYLPFHKTEFTRLLKIYDEKKDEYLTGKYDNFEKELKEVMNSNNVENLSLQEYLTYIDKHKEHFMGDKKLSLAKIQEHFKVNITTSKLIRAEYHNSYAVNRKETKRERNAFVDALTKIKGRKVA
jgi:hypothetical protein